MSIESVVTRVAELQSAFAHAAPAPPAAADSTAAAASASSRDSSFGGALAQAMGSAAPAGAPASAGAAPNGGVLGRPVEAPVTSGFGPRWGRMHSGVDLGAPQGASVAAADGGRVKSSGPAGAYGNLVVLEHPDGTETRYAHLASLAVRPGDVVVRGETVGRVGSTGRSTGSHLHFEVRVGGRAVDPMTRLPR